MFYAVSNCLIQYDRRVENNARILELEQTSDVISKQRRNGNIMVRKYSERAKSEKKHKKKQKKEDTDRQKTVVR